MSWCLLLKHHHNIPLELGWGFFKFFLLLPRFSKKLWVNPGVLRVCIWESAVSWEVCCWEGWSHLCVWDGLHRFWNCLLGEENYDNMVIVLWTNTAVAVRWELEMGKSCLRSPRQRQIEKILLLCMRTWMQWKWSKKSILHGKKNLSIP